MTIIEALIQLRNDLRSWVAYNLQHKIDKEEGKGLSTNDYTDADKNKLASIAAGAGENEQSDWDVTDPSSDAFIKNKPTNVSDFTNDTGFITGVSWSEVTDKPTFATVATSGSYNDLSDKPTISTVPDYLPNQYSLKFGDKSYNGSSEQTITAADLGLSQALKYHGVSETALADGSTTNPITILGESHTAESGCVVFYNNKEFVWNGSAWEELGDLSGVDFTGYATEKWVEENHGGTITGITMNGVSKGTSGVVDLGTVITQHQSLEDYVKKEEGKGLSANDYTDTEKTKLENLVSNVQSDWNAVSGNAVILNKPTLATVATTGSYTDLLNTPSIPTKTSDLTNDSNFITGVSWNDVTGKPSIPETYAPVDAEKNVQANWNETDSASDAYIQNKPTIPTSYAPTDAQKNVQSDWNEASTGSDAYIKNKPKFKTINGQNLIGEGDIKIVTESGGLTSESDPLFTASPAAGITDDDIKAWTDKYTKPTGGIPKSDLSSDVKTSLGKADTALQSYTEQYTGTYSKPDGGIPKTDLDVNVQTSLSKADSALQEETCKGTVTEIIAGTGLTGGTITGSGTIAVDTENYKLPTYAEWEVVTGVTGGVVGTVSSVGLTMPDAFTVTGSPITKQGTFNVTLNSDKYIPSVTDKNNWNAAEANVQSDWNETNASSDAFIKNKPTLATVATSGSYDDLSNKPTIPTGFSITVNSTDDNVVDLTTSGGTNSVTIGASHAKQGPTSGYTSGNQTTSISSSTTKFKIPQLTVNEYGHVTAAADEEITIDYPVTDVQVNGKSVVANKVANITISDSDTKCTSLTLSQGAATTPSGDTVEVIENKNITASGTGTSLSGTLTAVTVPTKEYTDKTFATITQVNDYTQVIAGSLVDLNNRVSYNVLDIDRRYLKPNTGIPLTDLSAQIQTSLSNADTAFGWGDHNNKYLSSEGGIVTGNITAQSFSITSGSNDYVLLAGGGTKPLSELGGTAAEIDPIFKASPANDVTTTHITVLNELEAGKITINNDDHMLQLVNAEGKYIATFNKAGFTWVDYLSAESIELVSEYDAGWADNSITPSSIELYESAVIDDTNPNNNEFYTTITPRDITLSQFLFEEDTLQETTVAPSGITTPSVILPEGALELQNGAAYCENSEINITGGTISISQGPITVYGDTQLKFEAEASTTTIGPTENGFSISNDVDLQLSGDAVYINAADQLELQASGISLKNVYINESSEIIFDDLGSKLAPEELNFAQDCGIIKMEEDDVMRIYGEGGIRLDSPVTCISDISAPAFYETSDARKKDIKSDLSLDKCYDLIDKCQTVIYSLKDQTKEQVGMIAQEIEEFFPEVVATDEEGFKSLAYDRLVVICFKVLKDVIKRLNYIETNL